MASNNEDLLGFASPPSQPTASEAAAPDLFQGLLPSSPTSTAQPSTNQTSSIDEEVLAGLSPAEREAFLKDQNQIMGQIEEKSKPAPAASNRSAAALAFEQRSTVAVARIAASYETGAALDDGVAGASVTEFKAAQIDEDAKLAAKLQEEEYAAERRRTERRRARAASSQNNDAQGDSWYDWMMGTATTPSVAPGTAASSNSTSRPAGPPSQGGARVAQSTSMFACVGNAISTAINPPKEVGGVDSASLLYSPPPSSY